MRVLIVTTWFPSADKPGEAPFNLAHAKAVADRHDVHVVHARIWSGAPAEEAEVAGLPVTRLPFSPRSPLAAARSLAALRRLARGADVVHTMAFSSLGVVAPLYPAVRRKWVHTEHWGVLGTGAHGKALAAAKALLRLPRRVSAVSGSLGAALRPSTRADVLVVPNVVSDFFDLVEQPAWSPVKLVAVGNLVAGKRPLLAVETLALLPEATLTWVGDGPLRQAVADRAAELGVADRLTLVGAVAPQEVPKHLAEANLFFLPTEAETFLVAAAEALACGRPVVLPTLPSVADYVDDTNGIMVGTPEPEAFAAAVRTAAERFAGHPAEAIRKTVVPRFAASGIADRFDELYAL
ncbi:glycosyltransferase [Actinokineospora soli]|uniref:Glycosyltransferase n=1 Tax=Actinokineospora soli TaxID=1048753 RepID=A0ABW2TWB1_9PSEU